MLLPLYVLCSKIAINIYIYIYIYIVYSHVSRDFARFPVFTVGTLVENLLVCGVLSLSHRSTPHNIGAKWLNLGFFLSSCLWSLTF